MPRSRKQIRDLYTISQLAGELDISPSTIRFYEEKGLIRPDRTPGNQRIYTRKDRARLKLILRGKRFGFSLDEISDVIGLAETDMNEVEQIEKSLLYIDKKCEDIQRQRTDLKYLQQDLLTLQAKLTARKSALLNGAGSEIPSAAAVAPETR